MQLLAKTAGTSLSRLVRSGIAIRLPSVEYLIGALVTAMVAALVWLIRPLRNRLDPVLMAATGDHGLAVRVFSTAQEMEGLLPKQMLGLDAAWLVDDDFFVAGTDLADGPPQPKDWLEWATALRAEVAGWRHILIQIQSVQGRAVLLMRPDVIVDRRDPGEGFIVGPQREPGGNGIMARQFHIELDAAKPVAQYFGDGSGEVAQFVLNKGETEAFLVIARADRGRYEWSMVLNALVDGKTIKLPIDDHGQPFISVGPEGLPRRWWHFDQRRWRRESWYPDVPTGSSEVGD